MKEYLTHLVCIVVLILISVTYFYPVLSNKSIQQSDISQFSGMSKQIVEHRENFNEEPYWLDNAFLGMPSYQVSAKYPFYLLYYIDQTLRFLPRPADYLFSLWSTICFDIPENWDMSDCWIDLFDNTG